MCCEQGASRYPRRVRDSVPAASPTVDRSQLFWYRWLLGTSAFFVLFGVASAVAGSLPPASLWGGWIAEHFFGGPMPEEAKTIFDFMRGPLGGTMAGHYVLQTALVAIPVRRGERWASVAIVAATLLWFCVDSGVSISHGAWFNVLRVNLSALVVTVGGVVGLELQARRTAG